MLAILAEGASVPASVLQRRGLSLPELYDDLDAVVATYTDTVDPRRPSGPPSGP